MPGPRLAPDATRILRPGSDQQQIGPEGADLFRDFEPRPGRNGYHADHRRDANDDAEQRQRAAQPIDAQRP